MRGEAVTGRGLRIGFVLGSALLWVGAGGALLGACGALDYSGSQNNTNNTPDGGVTCQYAIQVSPADPQVGNTVRLEVGWTEACTPDPQDGFTWSASAPGGGAVTLQTSHEGQVASFTPEAAGTYRVGLVARDLRLGERSVERLVTVVRPGAQQATYRLLLSPPVELGIPRQIRTQVVYGGTPVDGLVLSLDPGVTVSGQLRSEGAPVSGYVRLTLAGFDLVQEVRTDASGAFEVALLGDRLYDVLIVPDGDTVAPVLLGAQNPSDLADPAAFDVTPGVPVLGNVVDSTGAPLAGARVVLRTGSVPSTVGLADSFDGRFGVRARPGAQGLEVEPDGSSGLPRATVAEGAGIELDAAGGLSLRVQYADRPQADVTIRVVDAPAGGGAAVAGARVTLEATDLGDVAQVHVSQDGSEVAVLPARGTVRRWATADASGRAVFPRLPMGRYRAVLEPPAGAGVSGATTVIADVDLTGAPPQVDLALEPAALLEGWVVDPTGEAVADVHVVAVTGEGVGSAVETWSDAEGHFALDVIRGAEYQVILSGPDTEPPWARRAMAQVRVVSATTLLQGSGPGGALVLQPGLALTGELLYRGNPLAGVLVQALASTEPGTPVLADAVSDLNGRFRIVVPDPDVGE